MAGGKKIPTAPKPPPSNTTPPPSSGSSGSGSSGSQSGSSSAPSGGSGGSGGGGGSSDPYAYAKRQERKADNEAFRLYMDQAATMQQQIDALQIALGKKGFRANLKAGLRNINLAYRQADRELMRGYRDRVGSLKQAEEDNTKAAAAQMVANLGNRSRERANAMSEAMQNGAGESDVLRAQQMSLRNWQANETEIKRGFFDTRSSINSSLTDLTTDTRSQRMSVAAQANADREQEWQSYYDRRSETLTALGNALGQQAEYYGLANQAVSGRGARAKQKHASNLSGDAFADASRTAGKAYESPGVDKKLRKWDGRAEFNDRVTNAQWASASTELATAKPEGATLRKW